MVKKQTCPRGSLHYKTNAEMFCVTQRQVVAGMGQRAGRHMILPFLVVQQMLREYSLHVRTYLMFTDNYKA